MANLAIPGKPFQMIYIVIITYTIVTGIISKPKDSFITSEIVYACEPCKNWNKNPKANTIASTKPPFKPFQFIFLFHKIHCTAGIISVLIFIPVITTKCNFNTLNHHTQKSPKPEPENSTRSAYCY